MDIFIVCCRKVIHKKCFETSTLTKLFKRNAYFEEKKSSDIKNETKENESYISSYNLFRAL